MHPFYITIVITTVSNHGGEEELPPSPLGASAPCMLPPEKKEGGIVQQPLLSLGPRVPLGKKTDGSEVKGNSSTGILGYFSG